ncbi:hypothetical protein SAMN05660976_07495 [Nonomuraea pusilla]|uniref:Uncharacterized protein n=1 Tax=Nonomuraea pusilla TaxID=46177 RepID=A0A1H8GAU8_9ACTN|nr:hypothetical protein SAMN05660976_07495 [Nonomuraea pusilla]
MLTSLNAKCRPAKETPRPDHSRRIAASVSSMRLTRVPKSTFRASNWARVAGLANPEPMPAITRPPGMASRVASWCARRPWAA